MCFRRPDRWESMLCYMLDPLQTMDRNSRMDSIDRLGCFPRETAVKWAKTIVGECIGDAETLRRAAAVLILYAEEK